MGCMSPASQRIARRSLSESIAFIASMEGSRWSKLALSTNPALCQTGQLNDIAQSISAVLVAGATLKGNSTIEFEIAIPYIMVSLRYLYLSAQLVLWVNTCPLQR